MEGSPLEEPTGGEGRLVRLQHAQGAHIQPVLRQRLVHALRTRQIRVTAWMKQGRTLGPNMGSSMGQGEH